MTHLPAVVEVVDFAVEEDFTVVCVLVDFMVACVLVVSMAVAWPEDLGLRIP
jgi:hypothetical protein